MAKPQCLESQSQNATHFLRHLRQTLALNVPQHSEWELLCFGFVRFHLQRYQIQINDVARVICKYIDFVDIDIYQHNIRNIAIIGGLNHGKSTATRCLIDKFCHMNQSNISKYNSGKQSGITKTETSECISVCYQSHSGYSPPYLFHLIDTPGDLYLIETNNLLNIVDGSLIVVDCIEGICLHAEILLKQIIKQKIQPVVFINKLDKLLLKMYKRSDNVYDCLEQCYQYLNGLIEKIIHICDQVIEHDDDDDDDDDWKWLSNWNSNEHVQIDFSNRLIVHPCIGNVCFGSAKYGWAFTLDTFVDMYTCQFSLDKTKLMEKLWGCNCWDQKTRKWTTYNPAHNTKQTLQTVAGGTSERGFVQFILKPIMLLLESSLSKFMKNNIDVYKQFVTTLELGIDFTGKEFKSIPTNNNRNKFINLNQPSIDRFHFAMKQWLPAGDALFDICKNQLPSPSVAQSYRYSKWYSGSCISDEAKYIKQCDVSKDTPLSMYICKLIPTESKIRFIAFGRVFCGCVYSGQEIRILGAEYQPGQKQDLKIKKVQQVVMLMPNKKVQQVEYCPAGNLCGIVGIDSYIYDHATLTSSKDFLPLSNTSWNRLKFSVENVLSVTVEPNINDCQNLPKLLESLKRLSKFNSQVSISLDKCGFYVISGTGITHLEFCIKYLKDQLSSFNYNHNDNSDDDDYKVNRNLKISAPFTSYRETIIGKTGDSHHDDDAINHTKNNCSNNNNNNSYPTICVGKSPNKHSRVYLNAEPLSKDLASIIHTQGDENITLMHSWDANGASIKQQEITNTLKRKYNWSNKDADNIWSFGCPPDGIANCLVNCKEDDRLFRRSKDHIIGAFMQATSGGVLMDEPLYGIKFNLINVQLHSNQIFSGAGQVMPAAKKAFYSTQLASCPRIMEPVYLSEFIVKKSKNIKKLHEILKQIPGCVLIEMIGQSDVKEIEREKMRQDRNKNETESDIIENTSMMPINNNYNTYDNNDTMHSKNSDISVGHDVVRQNGIGINFRMVYRIRAYIAVSEMETLYDLLRDVTTKTMKKKKISVSNVIGGGGTSSDTSENQLVATVQSRFSHWKVIDDNPLQEGTDGYKIVMKVRQRKQLKNQLPQFNDFHDKWS